MPDGCRRAIQAVCGHSATHRPVSLRDYTRLIGHEITAALVRNGDVSSTWIVIG